MEQSDLNNIWITNKELKYLLVANILKMRIPHKQITFSPYRSHIQSRINHLKHQLPAKIIQIVHFIHSRKTRSTKQLTDKKVDIKIWSYKKVPWVYYQIVYWM